MNCLILGASSGLGRALAEELAAAGHRLALVSSDESDLLPLCADLKIRYGAEAFPCATQLEEFDPESLRSRALSVLGSVDALFCVAGVFAGEPEPPIADGDVQRLIQVNATAPIRIVNAFLPELRKSQRGNCVGIGSIAATRPRRSSLVYASAKAALEFYFLGIRHALAGSSCRVQFYRIGYMKTGMTFGRKLLFPAAEPALVARRIVRNLDRDLGMAYLPFWWRYVMLVYRCLPWAIYKRLRVE